MTKRFVFLAYVVVVVDYLRIIDEIIVLDMCSVVVVVEEVFVF